MTVSRIREMFFHEMGDDFSIGLGLKFVAFLDQLFLQAEIVLYDAVVDHHDLAGAIAMGMGVFFRRPAVRGPTGVAHAVGAVERMQSYRFFQIAQFAFRAPNL